MRGKFLAIVLFQISQQVVNGHFRGVARQEDTVDGKASFLALGNGRGDFGKQMSMMR